nr:hypothetical protein [Bacteroidota bacterium]
MYKGNSMRNNGVGLYLNTFAIFDPQTHAGNMWSGTFNSGYDAVNLNWSNPLKLLASLITVDSLLPKIYKPTVPLNNVLPPFFADDNGWVFPTIGGGKYECFNANYCIAKLTDTIGDAALKCAIARDSILSSELEQQTKSIAKLQLYKNLNQDSIQQLNSDLIAFKNNYKDSTEGKMYDYSNKTSIENYFTLYFKNQLQNVHQVTSNIER